MAVYHVSGETESGVESTLPLEESQLVVKQACRIEPTVRAGGPMTVLEIDDDDLLEIELDDGFVLWTTIDRLNSDTEAAGIRERGGDDFPTRYPLQRRDGERGVVSDAIRSVKVLGYDLPKGGALWAANKLENKLEGDGKFFRVTVDGLLTREDPPQSASEEPTLVLIHGTASSTANAYYGFFQENKKTWTEIHEQYAGRVYGFEHRTLTESPLENAVEFLSAIPEDANLHLVTHSRGGLVGDLVAHGGVTGEVFAADDLERELGRTFSKNNETYRHQIALYQEFNRLISEKHPNVQRYVRVGCPAAGTTLASGRLDIYLSMAINLLRQVPGVGPILGGLGELAASVAKERTKPEVLPGLESQMPKSAFIRLLNGSERELSTDLTVLAGDSDGFFKNLANLFYWRANDLVVDTRSMFGGAARTRRLWHLEENRHVTHVNYFRRFETMQVVQRGLMREDADSSGFNSHRPKGVIRGRVAEGNPAENRDLPGVILLPGIMGSHLAVVRGNRRDRVWLDKSDLMRGRGRRLALDRDFKIEPAGVLDSPYEDFRDYLVQHSVHVMPFAYDWRLSLETAAKLLDNLVKKRLAATSKPLHLMAHSMGGLVASLFMVRCPTTWQRLRDAGGRLVQAGTPNRGSYVIPRILQGEEEMIRLIAMLDLDNGLGKWTHWASRFKGILELAPTFGELDFSKVQTWKNLGVLATPQAKDLSAAEAVQSDLVAQTEKLAEQGVLYVAGGPTDTPVYDPSSKEIRFTQRGDGRVTWDSGIPPGVPTWYIPVKHGSLLDKRSGFAGLRELLLDGRTTQLVAEQPTASSLLRGAPLELPMMAAEDQVEFIPSLQDLEEAALGMEPSYGEQEPIGPPVMPCEISVVHGDLRFSDNPVIVGHYRGDQIVHAEEILDHCLEGALSSRHQLGVYPGDIGTAEVLLGRNTEDPSHRGPKGAIVLGLGNVGELSPGRLTRAVEAGLLRYAQASRERGINTSSLKVTALLVGSGEAGVSTLQALEAFLVAVSNANRALRKLQSATSKDTATQNRPPLTYFSHLEFIELFKDLALEALHSLCSLPPRAELLIRRDLGRRGGGLRRPRVTTAPGWWPRVQILADEPKQCESDASIKDTQILRYTAYGDRARAPVYETVVQKPLIDRIVGETLSDWKPGNSRLPKALFELLVPPSLKAGIADRRHLQLVLNEGSAVYPWELLVDRQSDDARPVGIGAGLLRQLRLNDVDVVSHPEENQILVVGDPPSEMPELPGARDEAESVACLFEQRGDWKVHRQIRGKTPNIGASSIIQSLLTIDVRILHLAGHGIYSAKHPMGSGMVIGGSGKEGDPSALITASEVRQMRLQPELVFINCCHLGRIEDVPPFHKLAASLATEFIRAGVKAVIAAGWPVNDEAAAIFCSEFYDKLLHGADLGTAVTAARTKTYHHESNTWGAYQCYGDPGFRLLMDLAVRSKVRGTDYDADYYLDPGELVIELGNLQSQAKVQKSNEEKEKIRTRRDDLWRLADRKGWLAATGVICGFARVAGELGDFETAIDLYERASRVADGGVTLQDLEQLANFRTRHGAKRNDIRLVERALKDLKLLIGQHGETCERLSLIGAAHKRLVRFHQKRANVRKSIHEMINAYVQAADKNDANWYYPASNALLGVVLLGGPWGRAPRQGSVAAETWQSTSWAQLDTFEHKLSQTEAMLRQQEIRDFFDAVASPDLAVVKALAEKKLNADRNQLLAQYKRVVDLYGSGREIDSVINHWVFAAETARKLGNTEMAQELNALATALALTTAPQKK